MQGWELHLGDMPQRAAELGYLQAGLVLIVVARGLDGAAVERVDLVELSVAYK